MSVSLTPINDPEAEHFVVNVSNSTWTELCIAAAPVVAPWNGNHDPLTYTPAELRAIAEAIPAQYAQYAPAWKGALLSLAAAGGAELS